LAPIGLRNFSLLLPLVSYSFPLAEWFERGPFTSRGYSRFEHTIYAHAAGAKVNYFTQKRQFVQPGEGEKSA
jgi:hypothetical protein